jgi:F0F1-type ATP synthase epsilon subunit
VAVNTGSLIVTRNAVKVSAAAARWQRRRDHQYEAQD